MLVSRGGLGPGSIPLSSCIMGLKSCSCAVGILGSTFILVPPCGGGGGPSPTGGALGSRGKTVCGRSFLLSLLLKSSDVTNLPLPVPDIMFGSNPPLPPPNWGLSFGPKPPPHGILGMRGCGICG